MKKKKNIGKILNKKENMKKTNIWTIAYEKEDMKKKTNMRKTLNQKKNMKNTNMKRTLS